MFVGLVSHLTIFVNWLPESRVIVVVNRLSYRAGAQRDIPFFSEAIYKLWCKIFRCQVRLPQGYKYIHKLSIHIYLYICIYIVLLLPLGDTTSRHELLGTFGNSKLLRLGIGSKPSGSTCQMRNRLKQIPRNSKSHFLWLPSGNLEKFIISG